MKKLQLKALEFGAKEVLTRAQLRNVMGGSGGGSGTTNCSASCPPGQEAKITNCNGDCTGHTGYAECKGPTATLTKRCA